MMKKDETIRINAYIASSTPLSRRSADRAVEERRVKVNGKIAHMGQMITSCDVVELDGVAIEMEEKKVTYALNKPKGYICSSYDPHIRHYARNLIKVEEMEMLHSIGRLDKDSEGLILFTTDGALTYRITHPKNQIEKEYYIKVSNPITDADTVKIKRGVLCDGELLRVKDITLMTPREALIVLTEGKNREIRRIFESIGNEVISLVRLRIGGYTMPATLKTGMFRKMSDSDLSSVFRGAK